LGINDIVFAQVSSGVGDNRVKFSVITVCLNAAKYINETIESVLSQDFSGFELIFIDGGSVDSTLDIVKDLACRELRVKWISEHDGGIADAMNKGIRLATGDVIVFLHADDYFASTDVLSLMSKVLMAGPHNYWATGGVCEIDEFGNTMRNVNVRRYSRRRLLRNNIILHPATFVRREAFELVGAFDTSLRYSMDYEFWLRLSALGPPIEVSSILTNFRVHKGSISTVSHAEALIEEYQVRKRYLHGFLSSIGHGCYQLWRLFQLFLIRKSIGGYHVSSR
jgi:glycosyltransferase involved in cell wall biosynthesis